MPSRKTSNSGNLWFTINHLCLYGNIIVDFYSFPTNKGRDVWSFKYYLSILAPKGNRKKKSKSKPYLIQIIQKHEKGFSNK